MIIEGRVEDVSRASRRSAYCFLLAAYPTSVGKKQEQSLLKEIPTCIGGSFFHGAIRGCCGKQPNLSLIGLGLLALAQKARDGGITPKQFLQIGCNLFYTILSPPSPCPLLGEGKLTRKPVHIRHSVNKEE